MVILHLEEFTPALEGLEIGLEKFLDLLLLFPCLFDFLQAFGSHQLLLEVLVLFYQG